MKFAHSHKINSQLSCVGAVTGGLAYSAFARNVFGWRFSKLAFLGSTFASWALMKAGTSLNYNTVSQGIETTEDDLVLDAITSRYIKHMAQTIGYSHEYVNAQDSLGRQGFPVINEKVF